VARCRVDAFGEELVGWAGADYRLDPPGLLLRSISRMIAWDRTGVRRSNPTRSCLSP
jgi:hypothetical protein